MIFDRVSSDICVLETRIIDFRASLKRYCCFGNQNHRFSIGNKKHLFSTASQAILVFWKRKLLIFKRDSSDIAVLELKTIDFRVEIKTLIFYRVSSDICLLDTRIVDFRARLKRYCCLGN